MCNQLGEFIIVESLLLIKKPSKKMQILTITSLAPLLALEGIIESMNYIVQQLLHDQNDPS